MQLERFGFLDSGFLIGRTSGFRPLAPRADIAFAVKSPRAKKSTGGRRFPGSGPVDHIAAACTSTTAINGRAKVIGAAHLPFAIAFLNTRFLLASTIDPCCALSGAFRNLSSLCTPPIAAKVVTSPTTTVLDKKSKILWKSECEPEVVAVGSSVEFRFPSLGSPPRSSGASSEYTVRIPRKELLKIIDKLLDPLFESSTDLRT